MKKPSLKNKLTADKIEAANRLLVEQSQSENIKTSPEISPVSSPKEDLKTVQISDKVEKTVETQEKTKPNTKAVAKKTAKNTAKMLMEEPANLKMVRVTIDIPENIHEKLKIKMILSKQTIKQYLLDFIEKDLSKSDLRY